MGQVLAVISGKGGTGKTSVCAGVAGCLCLEGARVLCIDADLGLRNLDISLGMASEASVSFLEVMRGDYTLEQAPRAAGLSGLQLLTAPVSVCAEDLDGAQCAWQTRLPSATRQEPPSWRSRSARFRRSWWSTGSARSCFAE